MALLDNLFWIGHASFYMKAGDRMVFIDPYMVPEGFEEKADIVLVTHAHFDHCSEADIKKVAKQGTKVVAAPRCAINSFQATVSEPGWKASLEGISIEAVPAYNTKKERIQFHPSANRWVGYKVTVDGETIYHAGDTDFIEEMDGIDVDVALLPMGGTYTMDVDEAIGAANAMKARTVVPMHYKGLLGKERSAEAEKVFKSKVRGAFIMREIAPPKYSIQ